jgi:AraC family transcriptional regulator of adaptative response/methylated-DNA-[protein]-cysteine methyltransferase
MARQWYSAIVGSPAIACGFDRKKRDASRVGLLYIKAMRIIDPREIAAMEAAFAQRDRSADGRFVVAVATTRIYCRPSCPARRPRPENYAFFSNAEAAREAGYRPCRRCLPDDVARDERAVLQAIAAIKQSDVRLGLADLAELTGYSPTHFQRVFKRMTGLSPAGYARQLRDERARNALSEARTEGGGVAGAIYAAGYEAPSRFYADAGRKLGMEPSVWARGGEGATIRWSVVQSSFGPMLVAATDKGICRLSFGEGENELQARFPNAELAEGGSDFATLLQRVVDAVEHPGTGQDIPLDVRGTAFQEAVWRELRRIPSGETRSYAEIAAAAGKPKAVRAAGSANGANNVAVLIPCHRVVRSDGSLGGYAYGNAIKAELLKRERG